MIQGTTPSYTFTTPFNTGDLTAVRVTFKQTTLAGEVLVVKEKGDCKLSGNTVSVQLTQAESLGFEPGIQVYAQLRVMTGAGAVLSTEPFEVDVVECLDGEVLA